MTKVVTGRIRVNHTSYLIPYSLEQLMAWWVDNLTSIDCISGHKYVPWSSHLLHRDYKNLT